MYNPIREIFMIIIAIFIVLLYIFILRKKSKSIKIISMITSVILFISIGFLIQYPIENAFYGFSSPDESLKYSFPTSIVKQIIYYDKDNAVIIYSPDKDVIHTLTIGKNKKGWEFINLKNNKFYLGFGQFGINITAQRLQNSQVSFVCAYYVLQKPSVYLSNEFNANVTKIDSIIDTNNSNFNSIQIELNNATEYWFYTFTNVDTPSYSLIINGNKYAISIKR